MPEMKKTTGKGSQKKSKTQKRKRSQKTRLHVVPKPSGPDIEFMDAPSLGATSKRPLALGSFPAHRR